MRMHKKIFVTLLTVLLITVMYVPAAFAAMENNPAPPPTEPGIERQIKLSDEQKKELKSLYLQMIELKKQIVNKYLEFGAITKDQAERRILKLDEMKKKIEQGDFTGWPKKRQGHAKVRQERKTKPEEVQPKAEN